MHVHTHTYIHMHAHAHTRGRGRSSQRGTASAGADGLLGVQWERRQGQHRPQGLEAHGHVEASGTHIADVAVSGAQCEPRGRERAG